MEIEISCVKESSSGCKCTITFSVRDNYSVKKVKEIVKEQLGIPICRQQLRYDEQQMENDKRLSDYSLPDKATIQLTRLENDLTAQPEIAKFQENFDKLCTAITNPAMFAAQLYSAKLITCEVRQSAEIEHNPCCARAVRLMSAVEAQISIDPEENFKMLVKVLCKERCLQNMAKILDPTLAEEFIGPCIESVGPVPSSNQLGTSQDSSFQRLTQQEVLQQVAMFEKRFGDLALQAEEELNDMVTKQPRDFKKVKQTLFSSTKIKCEHKQFLKVELRSIKNAEDIEELFMQLNLHWTFLDYIILEVFVNKYASKDLKEEMQKYVDDLRVFRQRTVVSLFAKSWEGRADPPPDAFTTLRAKLNKDASHCTLEELDQIRKDFCAAYHLPDSALMLYRLAPGSILVAWLLPIELERHLMSTIKRFPVEVFCTSRDIECLYVGEHKVHSDMVFEEVSVPEQRSLRVLLDKGGSECLNQMDLHPYTDALIPGPLKYLESDCDQQLIISLVFKKTVKLHTIQLTGPLDGRSPKTVRLFINQEQTLGFEQAENRLPVQEFCLDETHTREDSLVQLNFVKYQNVKNLTIFIKDNQGDMPTTVVHHIGLYGNPVEAIDMSEFARVCGDPDEEHVHAWQFHCP